MASQAPLISQGFGAWHRPSDSRWRSEVLASANTQDTNVTPAVLGTVETLGFCPDLKMQLGFFHLIRSCLDSKYIALK